MFFIVLAAGLHFLALGLGLGGLFARGYQFRSLERTGNFSPEALKPLFLADNFWGLAALLWISTGLWRAFGNLEKDSAFYLHNPLFFIKMALFGLVFAMEILPMVTLLKWRFKLSKKGKVRAPKEQLGLFILLNNLELAIVLVIPFVAAAMARGIWLIP